MVDEAESSTAWFNNYNINNNNNNHINNDYNNIKNNKELNKNNNNIVNNNNNNNNNGINIGIENNRNSNSPVFDQRYNITEEVPTTDIALWQVNIVMPYWLDR